MEIKPMSCMAGKQSSEVQYPASRVCCVSGSVRCLFSSFFVNHNLTINFCFNFRYRNYNILALNEQTFAC